MIKKGLILITLIFETFILINWLTKILTAYVFVLLIILTEIEANKILVETYKTIGFTILMSTLYLASLLSILISINALIRQLKQQKIELFHKIFMGLNIIPIITVIKILSESYL